MERLPRIKENVKELLGQDGFLLDFLRESASATFYNKMFSKEVKAAPRDLHDQVKQHHSTEGHAYRLMEQIVDMLFSVLSPDAIIVEIGGGMYQKRSGNAYAKFKNYFPARHIPI